MAYYPFATEIGATYRLVGPNGAVAVFNDILDPSFAGVLTEVVGLDSPEVRESADDLVQSDGGTHGDFYFGRRPISLSGRVYNHGSIANRNIVLDRARRATLALRGDSQLSWKPSTRQANLVTNPSIEVDTTGYAAVGGTNARIVGAAAYGAAFLRTTSTQTAGGFGPYFGASAQYRIPVTGNKAYTAGVHLVGGTLGRAPRIAVEWKDSAGAAVSTATGPTNTTTGFKLFTATAPAAAASAVVTFYSAAAGASGDTIDTDGWFFTDGTYVGTYFDGATAGYYWQGDPNASPSGDYIEMFTTVRRQQPWRETGAWNKDFQIQLVSEYAPLFSLYQKTLSAAGGANLTAENRGSWNSYPILRVAGPSAQNFTITDSTTGGVLRTTGPLIVASGETLEIDVLNHSARFTSGARNGQSGNRFIDYTNTATWPYLQPGNNTLTLSGTGTLTVLWRDSWV